MDWHSLQRCGHKALRRCVSPGAAPDGAAPRGRCAGNAGGPETQVYLEQAYYELSALSKLMGRLLNVDRKWITKKLKQAA